MQYQIKTICLALPYNLGSVNCYLIEGEAGYILIDTGGSNKRAELEADLERAGCKPGNLNLIILTHGDFDHTGNAAYLREKFAAKLAMGLDDFGMLERGDMFWNRKKGNPVIRLVAPLLFRFSKRDRCTPDLRIEDGCGLSDYGFEAQVIHIPGHSTGSIGILTAAGDLFCGDLLENTQKPALGSLMDDNSAANASLQKLKGFEIHTVYPGHGKPFVLAHFLNELQ
jgi:hydroxyacylglutathione hydrolase